MTQIRPLARVAAALLLVAAPAAASTKGSGLAGAYLSAHHAQATADAAVAAEYLDKALSLDAANPDLLRGSYMMSAQAGNFAAAVPAAQKFLEIGKGSRTTPQVIVAIGLYKKGEYEKAWEMINAVSGQGFIANGLPIMRAWFQAPRGTVDAALAELAPLQTRENLKDAYDLMAALINDFYGRDAEAIAHYTSLASRIDRQMLPTVRLVAAGYHRHGKSAELKPILDKYLEERDGAFAIKNFVDSFADPKTAPKKVTAEAGLAEAVFFNAQMMLQTSSNPFFTQLALVFGQMALHLNPDLNLARWVIGVTAAQALALDASNSILASIKRNDPGYVTAQLQIADNLERSGQKADALSLLQALAREKSDLPEIHSAIGDLLRVDQKFADAVAAYDKAFALYPNKDPGRWGMYYTRGIVLERSKQWDRAEADFRKALELAPDEPGVLNYLGYSWLDRQENLVEARKLIEAAYKKRPDDGSIVDSLGWAYYLNGEYEKAVTQLERAVELQASDSTINAHLGDAYWKVGRRNEARFQWRRALTLAHDEAEKTALRAKLDQGLAQN